MHILLISSILDQKAGKSSLNQVTIGLKIITWNINFNESPILNTYMHIWLISSIQKQNIKHVNILQIRFLKNNVK